MDCRTFSLLLDTPEAERTPEQVREDLLDEFGAAEACWHFEDEGFRGVVAMDAHGRSLFAEVEESSRARAADLASVR